MLFHNKNWKGAWWLSLAVYSGIMIWLLFFRSRSGVWRDDRDYWQQVAQQYNLIPLRTIRDYWHVLTHPAYYLEKWEAASVYRFQARQAVINLFGNIGMLIPLGFLLPACCQKLRKLWKTLLVVTVIIVMVEITQLFTLAGRCDIDDLLLNLLGATLGYGVFKLLQTNPGE